METDTLLSAREIGDGFPVLFIHGWEMNGRVEELDFEPIFTKASGYRRIYVDLPGMGATLASGVQDLDDILLRLEQFVNARLGKSRFLLAGSSCGGYLARAIAQKYVDQVDGLLLRVPLIEPEDGLRDLDAFQPIVSDEQLMSSIPTEDKALLGDVLIQTPAYIKTLKAKYENSFRPAIQAADQKVLDPIRADPRRYQLSLALNNKQSKLLAPTLILCGRQDDTVGYRDALRLLELYPRSTFAVLDRGRHDLPVDDNGIFEALVRDWLIRVEEWQACVGK
jgi:pimeloyl-ACP methyl ester carboxylesterase